MRRFRLIQRRTGRETRAWPVLLLLLMVVVVGIGCVLWFMHEAMANERLAVREKLAEAYRGQLALVRTQLLEQWRQKLGGPSQIEPAVFRFGVYMNEGLADSVICFDVQGQIAYPRLSDSRDASVNAQLFALESFPYRTGVQFNEMISRLYDEANDYTTDKLPSTQRLFLMHQLRRLHPQAHFFTLSSEELAAHYLESNPVFNRTPTLHATELRDVWSVASSNQLTLALFTTASLQARLNDLVRDPLLPKGVSFAAISPSNDIVTESTTATVSLGPDLPGWRLALLFDDGALFDTAADQRATRYLVVGSVFIGVMTLLAILIARGMGRQMRLTRLKNDLVANVSHELKTPLTAMRGLVETLLDSERLDEKTTREYLRLLATENARLDRLIENFLTFSRLERNRFNFEFTRVRPGQVVEGAIAALGERIQTPGCNFESHVVADASDIRGDTDALVTALLNLVDNAWKYSGEHKHITLKVSSRNGSVFFAVMDNGIGLTPGECKQVFYRFYQADQRLSRTAGGCGLGLSIVQSIVDAHGGAIRVESEQGKGSTFTMEIPAWMGGAA